MVTVDVSPAVLEWAQRHGRRDDSAMLAKFKRWDDWLNKEAFPTFKQLQDVAAYTKVPFGMLLLPKPPHEELPIPDFRTPATGPSQASAELLDTIYLCQRRQDWYEDYLADTQGEPQTLNVVGSLKNATVSEAAQKIREELGYEMATRAKLKTSHDARNYLIEAFEELGGLVVINSIVGNNTHRPLDRNEFAGFTLHSKIAPLVFVNGKDTKNRQVLSLLHEFAHVWRGESGVSGGGDPLLHRDRAVERWCDAVAAEIAVPEEHLRTTFRRNAHLADELDRLQQIYLCSTLVILIRLRDLKLVSNEIFDETYDRQSAKLQQLASRSNEIAGGNFYYTARFRVGNTLGRAIVHDVNTGRTSMTQGLRLLGFNNTAVFDKYASHLGGRNVLA